MREIMLLYWEKAMEIGFAKREKYENCHVFNSAVTFINFQLLMNMKM